MSTRCSAAVAIVVCALLATPALAPGAPRPRSSSAPAPGSALAPAANLSLPALTVAPSTWWTVGGSATPLTAIWSEAPPGCGLVPAWYRWSVETPDPVGRLTSTQGPSTNFSAATSDSGTSQVDVVGAATVACGSSASTIVRRAAANLTVDAPLRVLNLSLDPDPVAFGTTTNLTGDLAGGVAPYRLRVDWGDGNVTTANASGPGTFSVPHLYGAGTFLPSVVVTDSAGLAASAVVPEAISVGSGPEVGLRPSTYLAEVGVPVSFEATVLEPPMGWRVEASCSSPSNDSGRPALPRYDFACTFGAPGTANVTVRVLGFGGGGPVAATAVLAEPVAARVALSVEPAGPAELGLPAAVVVDLSGGVPPFRVAWQIADNTSSQSAVLGADGAAVLPVWPASPGAEVVSVEAVDALGLSAVNGSTVLDVNGPLGATAAVVATAAANGTWLEVSGGVTSGAAPFDWAVSPDFLCAGTAPGSGTILSAGPFAWSCRITVEGTPTVSVAVVDAAGRLWSTIGSLSLGPPLTMLASIVPGSPGRIRASVTLSGGAPPIALWVNASSGTQWSTDGLGDATYVWQIPVAGSGPEAISVVAVDQRGASAAANATPIVTPGGAAPSGSDLAWGAASALVVAGGGLFYVTWWRPRHRPTAGAPAPDPETVLKQIIEPADGADRGTVELLAEEEGVPLDVVRTTLDRWIADGTVRAERGSDGQEILAWGVP